MKHKKLYFFLIILTSVFDFLVSAYFSFGTYIAYNLGGAALISETKGEVVSSFITLLVFSGFLVVSIVNIKYPEVCRHILMLKIIPYLYYFIKMWFSFIVHSAPLGLVFIPFTVTIYLFLGSILVLKNREI